MSPFQPLPVITVRCNTQRNHIRIRYSRLPSPVAVAGTQGFERFSSLCSPLGVLSLRPLVQLLQQSASGFFSSFHPRYSPLPVRINHNTTGEVSCAKQGHAHVYFGHARGSEHHPRDF
jgi:hypothetical protein